MVDFHHPWLVAAALVLAAVRLLHDHTPGVPLGSGVKPVLKGRPGTPSARHLRTGLLACLLVAAAGPHRSAALPGDGSEGVAMMIALDVSESMGDPSTWGPRKIDVAVGAIRTFLEGRPHDLVGLVTFHRTAALSVPPMLEREVVVAAAERGRREVLGDGTSLGVAVGFAADRLRGVEARSKAIILVTDGESNAGALDPMTAARAAQALGQRLFVIEVGAGAQGSELLSQLAVVGGGRHFPAGNETALNGAYEQIDALEPTRFAGAGRRVDVPALGLLLWVAVALLALELGLRATSLEVVS